MINLFENYGQSEIDLEDSLLRAGFSNETIVLNDDGYLPPHIKSPISFFLGKELSKDMPLFFNEITVPNFWEIRGDNTKAEIYEGYKKKGKINYSKRKDDFRRVHSIEWFNDQGKIRQIDLYNQYGKLFGKKTYSDGELTLTTYFDFKKRETILMNHVTNTVQVLFLGKEYIFNSYIDFVLFYFKHEKLTKEEIIYNSLGKPFFITLALKRMYPKTNYNHILFWQENSIKIPGNMQGILTDKDSPTKKIIVQNRDEYIRLTQQNIEKTYVPLNYLGMIYEFKRSLKLKKEILILTNSDQIIHLESLIQQLPNFKFNVAAYTEMSAKLLKLNKYKNAFLYPTISPEELNSLINKSSIYLDINKGNEVDHIIRTSFENNLLIFGFASTVHSKNFINKNNIYEENELNKFTEAIKVVSQSVVGYRAAIGEQHYFAGQSTIEEYNEVLKWNLKT